MNEMTLSMAVDSEVEIAKIAEIERLLYVFRTTPQITGGGSTTLEGIRNIIFNLHQWELIDPLDQAKQCFRCGKIVHSDQEHLQESMCFPALLDLVDPNPSVLTK